MGGPPGALIVLAARAVLTPRLGAGLFIALVIGGQLWCSVLLDHFAPMGLPGQPITAGRARGAVPVVAGVAGIKPLGPARASRSGAAEPGRTRARSGSAGPAGPAVTPPGSSRRR